MARSMVKRKVGRRREKNLNNVFKKESRRKRKKIFGEKNFGPPLSDPQKILVPPFDHPKKFWSPPQTDGPHPPGNKC